MVAKRAAAPQPRPAKVKVTVYLKSGHTFDIVEPEASHTTLVESTLKHGFVDLGAVNGVTTHWPADAVLKVEVRRAEA